MGKLRSSLEPATEMQIAVVSDLVKDRQGHPETNRALAMMQGSMERRGFIPEAMALQVIAKLAEVPPGAGDLRATIIDRLHDVLAAGDGNYVVLDKDFVRQVYDHIQSG